MSDLERRSIAIADAGVELRADGDGPQRFVGLAAVYSVRQAIGNPKTFGFFEEFAPGTFTDSLRDDDQRMLIDHDTYYIVSRVSAGDLRLSESARGVHVDSDLDSELSYVSDLIVNVRKRRITGMSIGFYVKPGGAQISVIEVEEQRPDGKIEVYKTLLRRITAGQLVEVSGVTFPAFEDTEADLRARPRLSSWVAEQRAAHGLDAAADPTTQPTYAHPDADRILRHRELGRRIRARA